MTMTANNSEAYRGVWLTVLLSALLGFASISTDLYLPAMPSMGASLGATQGQLELTVSGYLLGFAFGQLFWGPVSDRFGRKLPLMLGIAIFIAGAAGCALSVDAVQLITCRIVQALGASAGVVLGRAMVRDLFHRDEAARMLSTLMLIMSVAPMLGPSVGAQILALSSWHYIFWTLVAIGTVTLLGVGRTAESLPSPARSGGTLAEAFAAYGQHLRNAKLMAYAAIMACFGAGVFAYVAGSSFVFIEYYGLPPASYGLIFASGIVGIMLSNTLNLRFVGRFGSDRMMLIGTSVAALAALILLVVVATGWGGWIGLAAALFAYIGMNGLIGANTIAGGLSSVDTGTGSASALLGFAQYGGGMVGSALVSTLANGTPWPMALIICVSTLCAGTITWVMNGRHFARLDNH
ncbi:multidrug effflux MFS transporter [Devosia sp. SL43]|uniref:multidrug effflux MFS transporter n=1 Tax=Devosia sp. SL43 TaxID=2806348 RepID=UPI001F3CA708|nr:multidrug effflux MFS transporter [Devosia sp. SL43]UJW84767.1 multidrug effflux MFS transporter [Devosia sp. SL43]